jgi:hypothetical protein
VVLLIPHSLACSVKIERPVFVCRGMNQEVNGNIACFIFPYDPFPSENGLDKTPKLYRKTAVYLDAVRKEYYDDNVLLSLAGARTQLLSGAYRTAG